MKNVFYLILVVFGLMSCKKENIGPPNPPQPIITDSLTMDSTLNLVGGTWIITGYRVGEIGPIITTNDTVVFNTISENTFNGDTTTYSLYPTASAFNLTLNGTPWGNLSGTIYTNNIVHGGIQGLKFMDITFGSSNQTNYYLWMFKI